MSRWLFVALLLGPGIVVAAQQFHTSPECWKEPRLFHSGPPPEQLSARVSVTRRQAPRPRSLKPSPNNAYGYALSDADRSKAPQWHAEIQVFTERPYLVVVNIENAKTIGEPVWVNEKLLFVRVWWGRIAGSDLLLDVESERLVYAEMFEYGALAFEQYQAACSGQCPCPPR